ADTEVTVDLIISGDGDQNGPATFDPAVMTSAAKISGVSSVASEYFEIGQINGETRSISAVPDVAAGAGMFKLTPASGTLAWSGPDQAVIDVDSAKEQHLAVGDTIDAQFSRGEAHKIKIVGLYNKSDVARGMLLSGDVVKDFRIAQPAWGYVKVAPG